MIYNHFQFIFSFYRTFNQPPAVTSFTACHATQTVKTKKKKLYGLQSPISSWSVGHSATEAVRVKFDLCLSQKPRTQPTCGACVVAVGRKMATERVKSVLRELELINVQRQSFLLTLTQSMFLPNLKRRTKNKKKRCRWYFKNCLLQQKNLSIHYLFLIIPALLDERQGRILDR